MELKHVEDIQNIQSLQEQTVQAWRARYREKHQSVWDPAADHLANLLYSVATGLSNTYLSKRHRTFRQDELTFLHNEAVAEYYRRIKSHIQDAKATAQQKLEDHIAEVTKVFEVKDLATAAHNRAVNQLKIKAASSKELQAMVTDFAENGMTGHDSERLDMLVLELRERKMDHEADTVRLYDDLKWHVTQPWKLTDTYQELEMKIEDINEVANHAESGNVWQCGTSKAIKYTIEKLFDPRLELR